MISRKFWVRMFGWALMFLWFLIYKVHLLVYPLNNQWVNIIGGFVGATGTFLVLLGYYKLTRDEDKPEREHSS
jgi:hypothetical protein